MSNYKSNLKNITTFVFDYDGVLTNGTVVLTDNGEPFRTANVKDGYALQLAVKNGFRVAVISGGRSETIRKRMHSLGIPDVFIGVESKLEVFEDYLHKNDVALDSVLYMGDDIPDLNCLKKAGLSTCPSDAAQEVKAVANYISPRKGGEGCVRDVIEQVLKVHGKWMNNDAFSW
jgi:3-deoxy-D-manno-octulosonate 8-phosphate phosphatase (KDO 8-P phosphatase)